MHERTCGQQQQGVVQGEENQPQGAQQECQQRAAQQTQSEARPAQPWWVAVVAAEAGGEAGASTPAMLAKLNAGYAAGLARGRGAGGAGAVRAAVVGELQHLLGNLLRLGRALTVALLLRGPPCQPSWKCGLLCRRCRSCRRRTSGSRCGGRTTAAAGGTTAAADGQDGASVEERAVGRTAAGRMARRQQRVGTSAGAWGQRPGGSDGGARPQCPTASWELAPPPVSTANPHPIPAPQSPVQFLTPTPIPLVH